MKNYVQPGNTLTIPAPGNYNGGQGCLVGLIFGVVASDVKTGEDMDLTTVGVFDLAKWNTAIFTIGAPVYWDTGSMSARSSNDEDSNSSGESEVLIGVAVAVAGAGASTVRVKLGPVLTLV